MGIALMIAGGLTIFCCLTYLAGMIIGYAMIGLIYLICISIFLIYSTIKHNRNQRILQEDEECAQILEQEKYEEQLNKEKIRQAQEQMEFNERHQVVVAAMSKVRELKAKYPMADEKLFQEYEHKYHCTAIPNLNKIEEKMKEQQMSRSEIIAIPSKVTVEDTNAMELMEEKQFKQIHIRLFKDKGYFAVQVETPDYEKTITFPDLLKASRMMVLLENDIVEYNNIFDEQMPIPKEALITKITHIRNKINNN